MKKTVVLFVIISLVMTNHLFGNQTKPKYLQALLSHSTFLSPTDGPYIETYLSIAGKSVVFVKNSNNKYQGTVEVTLIFKQDNTVKNFKKYNLLSPETDDTSAIDFNFIDQQRFLLPNGTYNFEITITDKNNNETPLKESESVVIDFPDDKIIISSLQLVESYKQTTEPNILTKSGYDIVPYVTNFYPRDINKLTFYSEIYNTTKVLGENEKYLTQCFIESVETKTMLSDFIQVRKETAKNVNVLFNEFDISKLPSGNYNLVIEVRNKENKVIASNRLFFQRSNPDVQFDIKDIASVNTENTFVDKITDAIVLAEYIRYLYPISTNMEKFFAENQLKRGADIKTMQQYFLNFWEKRNRATPEKAWLAYLEEVKKVNADFSSRIRKGYETDRGRVYLQYGPPNTRVERTHEPNTFPYEIWHYYNLNNQTNVKFVFYNPDLVSNDYELMHSNCIGEIADNSWHYKLNQRSEAPKNVDSETAPDYWGNRALEDYNNPR